MNNMRRGFTMIELIFVIVIIGILAAVAIPKLANTATQAKTSVVKAFGGTLNRTVGPSMWADGLVTNTAGDITSAGADICKNAGTYTNFPDGISMDQDCVVTVDTAKLPKGTLTFVPGSGVEAPSWTFAE